MNGTHLRIGILASLLLPVVARAQIHVSSMQNLVYDYVDFGGDADEVDRTSNFNYTALADYDMKRDSHRAPHKADWDLHMRSSAIGASYPDEGVFVTSGGVELQYQPSQVYAPKEFYGYAQNSGKLSISIAGWYEASCFSVGAFGGNSGSVSGAYWLSGASGYVERPMAFDSLTAKEQFWLSAGEYDYGTRLLLSGSPLNLGSQYRSAYYSFQLGAVPEPLSILGLGLPALCLLRKRRKTT